MAIVDQRWRQQLVELAAIKRTKAKLQPQSSPMAMKLGLTGFELNETFLDRRELVAGGWRHVQLSLAVWVAVGLV